MPSHAAHRSSWSLPLVLAALLVAVLAACSSSGGFAAPDDTVGPNTPVNPTMVDDHGDVADPVVAVATGGLEVALGGMRHDVGDYGYQEDEFVFSGTAKTFPPLDLPPTAYQSRMIVYTPTDPSDYNGTTVVEWAEVSDFGQFELTVELNYQATMLQDRGYAFVLVSAEEGGVCDLGESGCTPTSLKGADPVRYATLSHPGDPYSFDIFNQALQAIEHPTGIAPLGDLDQDVMIVTGFQASEDKWFLDGAPDPTPTEQRPFSSYGSLNEYIANGADAEARLADAFLIDAASPAVTPEYRVPTIHHIDETSIRREVTPDTDTHVTWEIAGAPHADRWAGFHTSFPTSNPKPKLARAENDARDEKADDYGQNPEPPPEICFPGPGTGNMFPRRFTLNAAVVALDEWVRTGLPAPSATPIERTPEPPTEVNRKLQRDLDGNALGGLRSPVIDVPVASYDGEGCVAAGEMTRFTPDRMAELYPTHESYVTQLLAATDAAVEQRFLICQDAETIMRKASASTVGGSDSYAARPACAVDQRG
jgi:hypothetical protein